MCGYEIDAENYFLLESKLIMYFTLNVTFIIYFDNLPKSLDSQVLLNWTTYQQILPIPLEDFTLESDLLRSPTPLKEIANQIIDKKENFQLHQNHVKRELEKAKKIFLFYCYKVNIFFLCHYCCFYITYFCYNIYYLQMHKIKNSI